MYLVLSILVHWLAEWTNAYPFIMFCTIKMFHFDISCWSVHIAQLLIILLLETFSHFSTQLQNTVLADLIVDPIGSDFKHSGIFI